MIEWVLVPREPTEAMVDKALEESEFDSIFNAEQIWRSMLSAAPASTDGVQLDTALITASVWLERWAKHVGSCQGGASCTCGLTRVRYELDAAISSPQPVSRESE